MKVPTVFQLLHEIYGTFTLGLSLSLLVAEATPKREFIAVLISQKFLLFSWIRETPRRFLSVSVKSQTSSTLKNHYANPEVPSRSSHKDTQETDNSG